LTHHFARDVGCRAKVMGQDPSYAMVIDRNDAAWPLRLAESPRRVKTANRRSNLEVSCSMTSTRNHIEKTVADAYRKEIDQEENVWRSLPFFAATLALQLAAIFQILDRIPSEDHNIYSARAAQILLVLASILSLAAIVFLFRSILLADFRYVAPEPDLLEYSRGLDQDEQADSSQKFDAEAELKWTLATQYADATHNNRQINQRRALQRSIAGMFTLSSVLSTIALVGLVVLTQVPRQVSRTDSHAPNQPGQDCRPTYWWWRI